MKPFFAAFTIHDEGGDIIERGSLVKDFRSDIPPAEILRAIEEDICIRHGITTERVMFISFNQV
ncbi:hypothetical protein TUM12370_17920 [Salmonella enterica subsp. enterica serovar Choleraesuis]|nr:hypothetical protein TUM12370_17920 [Salmonella enterica subsp. enterica serovar Choleraesuis]